ncbi:MAG: endopeptidase La [Lachnospiraceae bacterium]|nr:endopeptidase La [Lachnospiraceae bacterium]MCH4063237.1 endopeptidase La [Lachnospiraceae bacterium]MCH4105060.1 endopeptidase La [Lachnospiraceae bacterium]MCI1308518.1 endopeptidase La [Lachnospiraceae bacterium]MCI1333084.1 endopeptidase La [Lachnospiraceae bacterium]
MLVVPVYNKLITPYSDIYFRTEDFQNMSGREPSPDEKVVLLVSKKQETRAEHTDESFYPIGVSGVVSEIGREGYVAVKTMNRVNVDMVYVNPNHSIDLTISRRQDIQDLDETESYQKLVALRKAVVEASENYTWGEWMKQFVGNLDTIGSLAAVLSPWLHLSNEQRYAVLAEDSSRKRTEMLEQILYEFLEVAKVTGEANASSQKEYQDAYRESAIKKQMAYLQKELDDMHPETVSDVRKFEKKIKEAGMNEAAEREAGKVLSRLKQEGQQSAETGMLYDYLDFVTGLPWKKEETKHIDLAEAQRILDEDHSGLKKVKQRIIQQIAVMNLKKEQKGSILLFVGAPGTGKTSIGRSIARALGRKYVRVSLGGVRDEADIRGHRRTYIGAMPGRIMDGISKAGTTNPVMVLDEVDKVGASYNGDPSAALLEVLDPEQNSTFTDHYMNVPYDLSDVMFICTANTTDTIPEPLLNRMEVIPFTGYTPDEKLTIAKEHLIPKAMEATGLPEGSLAIGDDTLRALISDYTMEAGVRGLRKRIDTLCRAAAVKVASEPFSENAEDEVVTEKRAGADADLTDTDIARTGANEAAAGADQTGANEAAAGADQTGANEAAAGGRAARSSGHGAYVITPDMLRDELDMRPVHHDTVLRETKPGVVTGLAWTQVGGEILYIETLLTPGTGRLILTGKLGDVMKESAQIAVSIVKAMFPERAELFEKHDLHIHVPEGAVPKDGPSAGITLTTAIASLVSGHAVDPTVAMTGEVSLRGAVTPIGGLPEKLMAAQRAGVKHVFIPKDNMDDLKDVAEEVREALTITPVSAVTDVLGALGIVEPADVISVV